MFLLLLCSSKDMHIHIHIPPAQLFCFIFYETESGVEAEAGLELTIYSRLVPNMSPKCLDYRHEPPSSPNLIFYHFPTLMFSTLSRFSTISYLFHCSMSPVCYKASGYWNVFYNAEDQAQCFVYSTSGLHSESINIINCHFSCLSIISKVSQLMQVLVYKPLTGYLCYFPSGRKMFDPDLICSFPLPTCNKYRGTQTSMT